MRESEDDIGKKQEMRDSGSAQPFILQGRVFRKPQ